MAAMGRPVDLMLYVGNRSGLRVGEIAGLRIGDLAWLGEGLIRVAHSYDGPLKEDKGGVGKVKWVPAALDAEEVLGAWVGNGRSRGRETMPWCSPYQAAKPQKRRRSGQWEGFRKEHLEDCWDAAKEKVNASGREERVPPEMTLYQATRQQLRHAQPGGRRPPRRGQRGEWDTRRPC
jgi:hypothetical protein